jgi:hypothetical protein
MVEEFGELMLPVVGKFETPDPDLRKSERISHGSKMGV